MQRNLPEAAVIDSNSAAVIGRRDPLDVDGRAVGPIFHTSPAGDRAIGFSGPTDMLVICDPGLRVAGIEYGGPRVPVGILVGCFGDER